MISIALCDGSTLSAQTLKYISEYVDTHKDVIHNVRSYEKPLDMLEDAFNGMFYDIYILEVTFGEMTGIELARRLRRIGVAHPVIFTVGDKSYALEAYDVGALQYLTKPLSKEMFFKSLDDAIIALNHEMRKQIPIKTVDGYRTVYLRNIKYAETQGKNLCVYVDEKDGRDKLVVRTSMKQFAEELDNYKNFIRCGSSYVLNIPHISEINKDAAIMSDGAIIPVPVRYKKQIIEAYEAFYALKSQRTAGN